MTATPREPTREELARHVGDIESMESMQKYGAPGPHLLDLKSASVVLAAYRALLAQQQWQPIESAPKDGAWFIVTRIDDDPWEYMPFELFQWRQDHDTEIGEPRDLGGITETPMVHTPNGKFYWHGGSNWHRATHWLPFAPPPPEEKGG